MRIMQAKGRVNLREVNSQIKVYAPTAFLPSPPRAPIGFSDSYEWSGQSSIEVFVKHVVTKPLANNDAEDGTFADLYLAELVLQP